jgi:hypothetical protein
MNSKHRRPILINGRLPKVSDVRLDPEPVKLDLATEQAEREKIIRAMLEKLIESNPPKDSTKSLNSR